jgi:hypothetical protein
MEEYVRNSIVKTVTRIRIHSDYKYKKCMTKDQNSRTKYFKCACYGHAVEVEHDMEFNQYNLAIWHYGTITKPLPWKERFRWAWRLFTTGNLWADEIILNEKTKTELVDFLLNTNTSNEKPKTLLHG